MGNSWFMGGAHNGEVHGTVADALPQSGLVAQQAVVIDLDLHGSAGLLLNLGLEDGVQGGGHGVGGAPVVADFQGDRVAAALAAAAAGQQRGGQSCGKSHRSNFLHVHVRSPPNNLISHKIL